MIFDRLTILQSCEGIFNAEAQGRRGFYGRVGLFPTGFTGL
jgi:hypothetical protein